jgi:hypothetical protein
MLFKIFRFFKLTNAWIIECLGEHETNDDNDDDD